MAEIIEAVVKDDGANGIRNEKLICRLSKEEKAFIEQSSMIFGNSPLFRRNGRGGVERGRDTAGTDFAARSAVGTSRVYPRASRAERGYNEQSHRCAVRGE